jgi:hypothetical protein
LFYQFAIKRKAKRLVGAIAQNVRVIAIIIKLKKKVQTNNKDIRAYGH